MGEERVMTFEEAVKQKIEAQNTLLSLAMMNSARTVEKQIEQETAYQQARKRLFEATEFLTNWARSK